VRVVSRVAEIWTNGGSEEGQCRKRGFQAPPERGIRINRRMDG
jgi:hypothetical protein